MSSAESALLREWCIVNSAESALLCEWGMRVVHEGSAREYVSGAREWCMRVVHEIT